MFATFGRTWNITKICWQILQKDRELILFPIFSGVALAILAVLVLGVGGATGAIGRLQDAQAASAGLAGGDLGLLFIAYFALSFIVIYFNTALVGAAMIRIRGGDPTVRDGLAIANGRLPQILGWSLISGTVGLLLRVLREQAGDNMFGQIIVSLVGGVWAYLTFFVVPTIVVEGVGPVQGGNLQGRARAVQGRCHQAVRFAAQANLGRAGRLEFRFRIALRGGRGRWGTPGSGYSPDIAGRGAGCRSHNSGCSGGGSFEPGGNLQGRAL